MAEPLTSRKILFGAAALCLASPFASAAEEAPTVTDAPFDAASRLDREIAMIRKGRLDEAERLLSRDMAAERSPRVRADLLAAFATQLFLNAPKLDDPTSALVLDYLDRVVNAYRLVLGAGDPEVATALIRRAEVERLLHPDDPAPWTDSAYQQAYRIRFERLGATSPVTLGTLIPMAELAALPSRSQGDPAKIEAAAAMLRQAVEGTAAVQDDSARVVHAEALATLQRLEAVYGAGRPDGPRPQIMTAGAARQCAGVDLNDAIIFSGEPAPLDLLRDRFGKAGLILLPCGSMLAFPLGPGVDPTPVLDLLTDISAGRIKGLYMGLRNPSETPASLPDGAR
ncbi:hypothetical protein [Rhizorhabdus histidinilytica]|uniref:hypothetical protein n=1 Tax=Rhizorhabdus histidinilytica TaxID=439228 RepID=UPI00321FCDEA